MIDSAARPASADPLSCAATHTHAPHTGFLLKCLGPVPRLPLGSLFSQRINGKLLDGRSQKRRSPLTRSAEGPSQKVEKKWGIRPAESKWSDGSQGQNQHKTKETTRGFVIVNWPARDDAYFWAGPPPNFLSLHPHQSKEWRKPCGASPSWLLMRGPMLANWPFASCLTGYVCAVFGIHPSALQQSSQHLYQPIRIAPLATTPADDSAGSDRCLTPFVSISSTDRCHRNNRSSNSSKWFEWPSVSNGHLLPDGHLLPIEHSPLHSDHLNAANPCTRKIDPFKRRREKKIASARLTGHVDRQIFLASTAPVTWRVSNVKNKLAAARLLLTFNGSCRFCQMEEKFRGFRTFFFFCLSKYWLPPEERSITIFRKENLICRNLPEGKLNSSPNEIETDRVQWKHFIISKCQRIQYHVISQNL